MVSGQTLDDGILAVLAGKSLKSAEIAKILGVDNSLISAQLHGSLRSKVRQDRSYFWSISENSTTQAPRARQNSLSGIFNYYLDALSADAGYEVSVFANSQHDLDYCQLQSWPDEGGAWRANSEIRNLLTRLRADSRNRVLWLGWPTLRRKARSAKGWVGAFVEPILLWPIDLDPEDGSQPRIVPEPQLNAAALRNLVGQDEALLEAIDLASELGLDEVDDIDPEDIALRLHALRSSWPWASVPDPTVTASAPSLGAADTVVGIHNAPVIVLGNRSGFTAGLERELSDLRFVSDESIHGSALGKLLDDDEGQQPSENLTVLEVLSLNAEQHDAVAAAMTRPITVVTGPPGTGKSQVVTSIIANAAYSGKRVLFAAKNHQGVDVVELRVNTLTSKPALLRLGPRTVQATLVDHLDGILSQRPDATLNERRVHAERLINQADERVGNIDQTLASIREIANDVMHRDQMLSDFRKRLGREKWLSLVNFDLAGAKLKIAAMTRAQRRASRANQPLFVRLIWPLLNKRRQSDLASTRAMVCDIAASLALPDLPVGKLGDALRNAVLDAAAAQETLLKEIELVALGDPALLTAERLAIQQSLRKASLIAFDCWLSDQGARLDQKQRRALGDYVALLRSIARTNEEGGAVAKKTWAEFYRLASEVSSCLPGWAVTSLSVRGRVPFEAGLFDLVVIDEASQCDIASALPLLYRAKRAVIIGDPRQLRHITRLPEQKNHALLVAHGVLKSPGAAWSYADSSLYDLVASRIGSDSIVALRDHHRSHPDIIGFSNKMFYEGQLRVATDLAQLRAPSGAAVRWVDVPGQVCRPENGSAQNQAEAEAVISELRSLTLVQGYRGTIGVVTPFRAQAQLIRERLERDAELRAVAAACDLRVGTADTYQGDERDLMLFSPVMASGITDGAMAFLSRDANRINVALTRARAALVIVGDKSACSNGKVSVLSRLAEYVSTLENLVPDERLPETGNSLDYPWVPNPDHVSDYERQLYGALAKSGIFTIPQHGVDQYRLDLALIAPDGRRLNIEIDGEGFHLDPWTGERLSRDILRDMRLMEMGWEVRRFWAVEVRDHVDDCVQAVIRWLAGKS